MSDFDPRTATIQQLKSAITKMGHSDELPNNAASKEDYITIYYRVSKKRAREGDPGAANQKRPKTEEDMEDDDDVLPESTLPFPIPPMAVPPPPPPRSHPPPPPPPPSRSSPPPPPPESNDHPAAVPRPEVRSPAPRLSPVGQITEEPIPDHHSQAAQSSTGVSSLHRRSGNRPSGGFSAGPVPSGLQATERKVADQPRGNPQALRWVMRLLPLLVLLCLLHWFRCASPTFCDWEGGFASSLHRSCKPCPRSGVCAQGRLVECGKPTTPTNDGQDCLPPGVEDTTTPKTWLCRLLSGFTALMIAAAGLLLFQWYFYWYNASQTEDVAAKELLGEVKELLGRYRGQSFLPANLLQDLEAKYPDLNLERIWPQVQMALYTDIQVANTVGPDGVAYWAVLDGP